MNKWVKVEAAEKAEWTDEKFGEVDWSGLESKIASIIGTSVSLTKTKTAKGVRLQSQNLASKAGVMAPIFAELYVTNFGSSYEYSDTKKDNYLWIPIHLSWKYKAGGSNGAEIMTVWYYFEAKQWTFDTTYSD